MTSRRNSRQSTLRCKTWLTPDAAVVKVSTACTLAEASAGGTPRNTYQQCAVDDPERHAERAIDHLRGETDQNEGQHHRENGCEIQGREVGHVR